MLRRFTPAGFSFDKRNLCGVRRLDASGGTGKPAVAYEAARSNARAALFIDSDGSSACLCNASRFTSGCRYLSERSVRATLRALASYSAASASSLTVNSGVVDADRETVAIHGPFAQFFTLEYCKLCRSFSGHFTAPLWKHVGASCISEPRMRR